MLKDAENFINKTNRVSFIMLMKSFEYLLHIWHHYIVCKFNFKSQIINKRWFNKWKGSLLVEYNNTFALYGILPGTLVLTKYLKKCEKSLIIKRESIRLYCNHLSQLSMMRLDCQWI